MIEIKEKDWEWGSVYRNGELAAGILGALLAYVASLGDFEGPRIAVFVIFLLISVVSFVHYVYLTKNRVYIMITSDGIHVASRYIKSKSSYIKWKNISKVVKDDRKRLLTLSLTDGNVCKIYLGSLNKDDRDGLVKIINEAAGQNPDT